MLDKFRAAAKYWLGEDNYRDIFWGLLVGGAAALVFIIMMLRSLGIF